MAIPMRRKPELHSVGVVRSVGQGGTVHDQGWIRCERRGSSVPVSECAECKERVAMSYDKSGAISSITCYDGAFDRAERSGHMEADLELPRLTVGDLMTRNVLCVRPDLSLDAVTELFVESGLKAVPVVDEHGALQGIVSESEVLIDVYARAAAGDGAERADSSEVPIVGERLQDMGTMRTVADVMVPFAFTLPEDAPITRAAAIMAFEGAYRITVVSAKGDVVGILSAGDVLYWLAKADGYSLPPPRRFGSRH